MEGLLYPHRQVFVLRHKQVPRAAFPSVSMLLRLHLNYLRFSVSVCLAFVHVFDFVALFIRADSPIVT